jgi:hypothetical protein
MALRIDENLQNLIKYLQQQETKTADALSKQSTGRAWFNFSEEPLSGEQRTATSNEKELHDTFNRDEANQDYVEARQNPDAKSREVALAKTAGDYLAAFERDGRMRRRTRIRMMAHSAARAKGQGSTAGALQRDIMDFLSRMFMKTTEKPVVGA